MNPRLPYTVALELIHACRFVLSHRLSSIDNSTRKPITYKSTLLSHSSWFGNISPCKSPNTLATLSSQYSLDDSYLKVLFALSVIAHIRVRGQCYLTQRYCILYNILEYKAYSDIYNCSNMGRVYKGSGVFHVQS